MDDSLLSPTQDDTFSVPFKDSTGKIKYAKPFDVIKAATPGSVLYNKAYAAWKSYGGALTGKKTFATFWKKIVTDSAGTGLTPLQTLIDLKSTTPKTDKQPTTSSEYITLTDRATADSLIDASFKATFGRNATKAEKDRFYTTLHGKQAGAKTVVTYKTINGKQVQTTTTTKIDEDAIKQQFLSDIITAQLKQKPTAEMLGQAGQVQDALTTYANTEMGLMKSQREINVLVAKVIGGMDINDAYRTLKDDAIAHYDNYAKRLKEDNPGDLSKGLTVRALANNYIQMMADTLELNPDTIRLTDKTIQGLISQDKLPTLNEAQKVFRDDARWTNTKAAIDESKNLGYSILRAFGYEV